MRHCLINPHIHACITLNMDGQGPEHRQGGPWKFPRSSSPVPPGQGVLAAQLGGAPTAGDKTRMEALALDPQAFVRPSPSKGYLGGVTANAWPGRAPLPARDSGHVGCARVWGSQEVCPGHGLYANHPPVEAFALPPAQCPNKGAPHFQKGTRRCWLLDAGGGKCAAKHPPK